MAVTVGAYAAACLCVCSVWRREEGNDDWAIYLMYVDPHNERTNNVAHEREFIRFSIICEGSGHGSTPNETRYLTGKQHKNIVLQTQKNETCSHPKRTHDATITPINTRGWKIHHVFYATTKSACVSIPTGFR